MATIERRAVVPDSSVAGLIVNAGKSLLRNRQLILPLSVVAELYQGAYLARSRSLETAIDGWLNQNPDRLVTHQPDQGTAQLWAKVRALAIHSGRQKHSLPDSDAWIAATALQVRRPLFTRNRKDFDFIPGLRLIEG